MFWNWDRQFQIWIFEVLIRLFAREIQKSHAAGGWIFERQCAIQDANLRLSMFNFKKGYLGYGIFFLNASNKLLW